jgi:hypothetical protein
VFGVICDLLSHEFAKEIKSEFEVSMFGKLNLFLGIQIKQSENIIFISQSKHARYMVKKFDIKGKSHACRPMSTSVKIHSDSISKCLNSTLYRSMIWSILYIIASRLDIAFNVGVYARFQSTPKESHLIAIKRILKYL